MVCGGVPASSLVSLHMFQIMVVICGGLRWCVVVLGFFPCGLWWFAVVCGDLR